MSLSREEIIRMARACGALELHSSEYAITGDSAIERFANAAYAAGAAAEREVCAKVCDRFQARGVGMQPAECAAAIRARGNGGEK